MLLNTIIDATNVLEALVRGLSLGGNPPSVNIPLVDELPVAPNRLTNYNTFIVDSPVFIDALLPFTQQVNLATTTLSLNKPNRWNMGDIVETNLFPTFTKYTGNPDSQVKPSVQYVSAIDSEYEYFKNYSVKVDDVLHWFDNIQTERGGVDVWNLPTIDIKPISSPMTRNMGETEFNSKSVALSKSMRDHTQSLLDVKLQVDGWFNATMDMGYITDPVTNVFDMGDIADTVISN